MMRVSRMVNNRLFASVFLSALILLSSQGISPVQAATKPYQPANAQLIAPEPLVVSAVQFDPENLSLTVNGNRPLDAGNTHTVLKLFHPYRLVVDIPHAMLDGSTSANQRMIPVQKAGIQRVELTEVGGVFYRSVRISVYVDNLDTLDKLSTRAQDDTLTVALSRVPILPAPASMQNSVRNSVDNLASSVLSELKGLMNSSTSTEEGATPASPVMADNSLSVIEEISYRDDRLIVQSRDSQGLWVKNRMTLSNPNRLVVDFDRATVSDKALLQPIVINSNGIRQIRAGQFDEKTVRLVIETANPKAFDIRYPVQGNHVVMIGKNLPDALGQPQGILQSVMVKPSTGTLAGTTSANTQIELKASGPIAYRLLEYNGDRLSVDLPNIAADPEQVAYLLQTASDIQSIRVEPAPGGKVASRLVVNLKGSLQEIVPRLSPDKSTLTLGIRVSDGLGQNQAVKLPTYLPTGVRKAPYPARVVIDPGHGGKDQGASRNGILEKDLNLAVALRLKDALEARGVQVYMTRSTDKYLTLKEISDYANSVHPDLFVSVHTNASTNPGLNGLETYYYNWQSLGLAKSVHQELVEKVPAPDRGVRKAMFYVIHHTNVPAILCEMGYISNNDERNALVSDQRQQQTVTGIANGVVNYLETQLTASARKR